MSRLRSRAATALAGAIDQNPFRHDGRSNGKYDLIEVVPHSERDWRALDCVNEVGCSDNVVGRALRDHARAALQDARVLSTHVTRGLEAEAVNQVSVGAIDIAWSVEVRKDRPSVPLAAAIASSSVAKHERSAAQHCRVSARGVSSLKSSSTAAGSGIDLAFMSLSVQAPILMDERAV
eukprot:CAMPEP_0206164862 /NCGR_PEP_ID=MMETSP1474-20131121/18288_1 /ASSEMBLY_ACC=CAM_ASM_001110 /TAXON_ID=97495 /ORGANISM="Imantonia sp., Strain RCC918" /LENGTH=177 /DNA_ID=CAMNT_0053567955 /DNA_START=228 /DNA_END=758 /DNA_ORIENTATION=-